MNSLRVRVALVLLASISLVVCLATIAAVLVSRHSARANSILPVAEQIRALATSAASGGSVERATPVSGEAQDDIADALRDELRSLGADWPARVTQTPAAALPVASVEVAPGRWLALPIPAAKPPPDAWVVLSGWMLLIFFGSAGVSLLAAHRVTRPLLLLETVAGRIGPNGVLESVPEDGPVEVRATARALNRLSRNLRQAMESRMRLVAAAGHDLRTPLTRMRLRAEFLDAVERNRWLSNIDELERIADSAIALVREEAGDEEKTAFRLDKVAATVVEDLLSLDLPIEVRGLAPVEIHGSQLAMTRALRNLAINAATHGGGGVLSLVVEAEHLVLTIEDDGPGIPPPLIGRVFEPFFRVDHARRQSVPGAGLGLAIAHEIILRTGGDLVLSNKPGGGLCQVVTFTTNSAYEDQPNGNALSGFGPRAKVSNPPSAALFNAER